jgi:hypothetical protein
VKATIAALLSTYYEFERVLGVLFYALHKPSEQYPMQGLQRLEESQM